MWEEGAAASFLGFRLFIRKAAADGGVWPAFCSHLLGCMWSHAGITLRSCDVCRGVDVGGGLMMKLRVTFLQSLHINPVWFAV